MRLTYVVIPLIMNDEINTKIEQIIEARKVAYKPTPLLLLVIAIGFITEYFLPNVGALFGILAFVIFYRRLAATAHIPCPKCGEPFGAATKLPLGVGSEQCQNCGLSLNEHQV